jgi:hypothetical protein
VAPEKDEMKLEAGCYRKTVELGEFEAEAVKLRGGVSSAKNRVYSCSYRLVQG